jgi:uncharacterized membrane protein
MPARTTKPRRSAKSAARAPQPKQEKPFFRTGTWVAVLLFAVLAGAIVYLDQRETQAEAQTTPTPLGEDAFVFENESAVTSIEVEPSEGETFRAERNAENAWVLKLPIEAEADQGTVEAAASQVAALKVTSELDADPKILGLDKPAFVITVEFQDGAKQTLEVGDRTPTGGGYYVRLEKKVMIVAASGIEALTVLPSSPPYLNTPTPTATATLPPTETPVPPTEAESTSEITETPQP